MGALDPVRGSGFNVNQHTCEGSRRRSKGVAEAPHGTHLACQVRSGWGITGRVEPFFSRRSESASALSDRDNS